MASSQDGSRPTIAYGEYIDRQIHKTGRQVKLTEIFGGVFLLIAGLLVFFLAAAIIDHWIVPLRTLGRWSLLLLLICGVITFVVFRLVPLVFRRVNPVYSAHTIERQAPAMKNSLVNHLVLRQQGQGVSKGVLRAVEQQAAQRLSQAPAESAVDRSRLIRLGYLLVGLMAAAALYKFFSPKDPLATFGRIAAPWSDAGAPTRVVIEQVRTSANPGGKLAGEIGGDWVYADQQPVQVDAAVRGLKRDEPVTLYWSTEDGRVEKQPIVMRPQGDGRQFRCFLPDENVGLRQNVRFFVAAGDARSPEFRIEVRTPPVIAVKSVEYRYPAYTHKRPETRIGGGDVIALAGTTVTLHAEANQGIKSASVDLGCDGTIDYAMQLSGQQATARFQLALDPQGRSPTSYLIRMANAQGHENPQPIRYSLQIIPDWSPTVKIVQPEARELQLPLNGSLPIVVQASDPDFALSSVTISAAPADSSSNLLFTETIFEDEAKDFTNADAPYAFRPDGKQLGRALKVGDTIHLWATARDNKHNLNNEPDYNRAESEKLVVHIIAPTSDPKMQPKQPEKKDPDQKQKEQSKEKQPGGQDSKQPEKKQDGNQKSNEKQKSDGSDKKQNDQKQPGDNGAGQPKEKEKGKEQSKSEGGSKDMNQLFNELCREAEKNEQAKEKQPPSGGSEKQKSSGGSPGQPPPDGGQKGSPDQPPQPGGGKKKEPGSKTSPGGMGETPSEHTSDPTDGPGKQPATGATESTGANKTSTNKLPGGGAKKGDDTRDADTPPSNRSDTKPKEEGSTPGKAAKAPSEEPGANPKSNEKAKGDAGAAKATNPGEAKKKEEQKADASDENKTGGDSKDVDSAPNSANKSQRKEGSPPSLSDTTKKVNNKAIEKKRSSDETQKDEAVSPSVNAEQNKNTNESGVSGEQKGGSKEGGGANGNKPGGGNGGSNTESDQGKGAGVSAGTGETGKGPGKKAKADTPTGVSGSETGDGSTTTQGSTKPGAAKSRPDKQPGGSDTDSGSAGGVGKQDSRGKHGTPQTGPRGDGQPQHEATKPTDPDLEAARKAADLVLKHIDGHPDEEGFKNPRVIELANRLRAMLNNADKNGPDGDIARHQLRGLSQSFSTRGMKRDEQRGIGELRGDRGLPGYADEYLERTGARPARKSSPSPSSP